MVKYSFIGAVLLAMGVVQGASAQNLRDIRPPAETPPSSFAGNQYVDSRGCVYIRSRGVPQWVPRVTRKREHLCGQQPSRVARRAAPVVQAPAPRVVQAPAPRVVVQQPRVAAAPVAVAPTRRVVTAPVSNSRAPVLSNGNSACPGAPASSQAYINSGAGVRCGSQQWQPSNQVTNVETGATTASRVVTATPQKPATVISSRRVKQYPPAWVGPNPDDRHIGAPAKKTPQGYREVWTDDRLSRTRGVNNGNQQTVVQPARASKAYQGHRYVQAGSYTSSGAAQVAASDLVRRGLPAKVGVGANRSVLLIGPFSTASELNWALNRTKSVGFGGAFTRK